MFRAVVDNTICGDRRCGHRLAAADVVIGVCPACGSPIKMADVVDESRHEKKVKTRKK